MTMTIPGPKAITTTVSSKTFEYSNDPIADLRESLAGELILPEDARYDEARQIRQILVDRLPAMIVQAANAQDVAEAVRFARTFDMVISVRSGGHSFAGHSVNDGGMVIDLRNLQRVSINPRTQVARAQPGVTSAVLGAEANKYGLALSTGDTSTVALGGLTLGGGIGWMVREQGLTIDNLLSVEMVTADGDIIRASNDKNPDLFWALRGGGGNFGVVTEFELQLHKVDMVLGGLIAMPPTPEVIKHYAEWALHAPEQLTTIVFLMQSPPAPFVPEDVVGKLSFIVMFCYTGEPAEGEAVLSGLRSVAAPMFEMVAPMPYPAIYALAAEGEHRAREFVRSFFMDEMSDDLIEATLEAMQQAGPTQAIQFRTLGGKMARVSADETAFAHRQRRYIYTIISQWPEGDDGESTRDWVRTLFERVSPHAQGVYVNFLQDDAARIREAYPGDTYDRLVEVKRRFDPDNVFSQNQNVRPRA